MQKVLTIIKVALLLKLQLYKSYFDKYKCIYKWKLSCFSASVRLGEHLNQQCSVLTVQWCHSLSIIQCLPFSSPYSHSRCATTIVRSVPSICFSLWISSLISEWLVCSVGRAGATDWWVWMTAQSAPVLMKISWPFFTAGPTGDECSARVSSVFRAPT